MFRILSVLLLSLVPIPLKPFWKESGYIGSCAARGCMGLRSVCSIYSFPAGNGERNTFYCYLDQ